MQCLSNNCSGLSFSCSPSQLGQSCLLNTDCTTGNCTNAVCIANNTLLPLNGKCLSNGQCDGFPASVCDSTVGRCKFITGNTCNETSQCVSGNVCEIPVCAVGFPCLNEKLCVNAEAAQGEGLDKLNKKKRQNGFGFSEEVDTEEHSFQRGK